jgi:hypothetical protein
MPIPKKFLGFQNTGPKKNQGIDHLIGAFVEILPVSYLSITNLHGVSNGLSCFDSWLVSSGKEASSHLSQVMGWMPSGEMAWIPCQWEAAKGTEDP